MIQLARRLSPMTLFMLSMNGIIGSGWLFAPLYTAKIAGAAAIFSWIIGGIAAILIAFTFAELSLMIPVAGGSAHVPQLSHGTLASFVLTWVAWITSVMIVPLEVQAVLQYAAYYFPSLIHTVEGAAGLSGWGYLWATILMMSLCAINIFSYKGLVRLNFILFVIKFTIILITIYMVFHAQFNPGNFSGLSASLTSKEGWQAIFSAISAGGIVLAYNGFKNGIDLAGETKNLAVAIPLSTVGCVIACMLIYLALQICFIGGLDPASIKHGWNSLGFSGEMGPFLGLVMALGLFYLAKLLYMNAIISPLGAGLIYVTVTARIVYAMSKIGYVPAFLSKLNRHQLPMWAIIINFGFGMLSFLPLPGWQAMVKFLVSAMVISYAMGPISLIALRKSLPNQARPFKLPFANSWCLLAFYICNLFSYWTGWQTISKLAMVLFVGLFLFFTAYWRGKINVEKHEFKSMLWIAPYLVGLVVISYLGAFGGIGVITFGYDFIVIALFSMSILYLAVKYRSVLQSESLEENLKMEMAVIETH